MRLNAKQRYVLRVVYDLGPTTNRAIAREAGLPCADCYAVIVSLRQHGFVRPDAYQVSDRGAKLVRFWIEQPRLFERTMFQ